MSYQTTPTKDGVYRIVVFDQDLCIERVSGGGEAGLKLSPLSGSSHTQNWKLKKVAGEPDAWTIASAYDDQWGLTYVKGPGKYWGQGYPFLQEGPSQNWSILVRTSHGESYSKIGLKYDDDNTLDCFDSTFPGSDGIHFNVDQPNLSSGPKQCYVFELIEPSGPLDVLFLQDVTGFQAPYVDSVRKGINQIYTNILDAGKFSKENLRFGLVAFRDHKPNGSENAPLFVTKSFPFGTDPAELADEMASLDVTGGYDGPECQSDALFEALNAKWEDQATKIAILITDSPPHGIGEQGDGFPNGYVSPFDSSQKALDPLTIADAMAKKGIALYVLACEPTLSQYYKRARDFYTGLTKRTGADIFDMGDPDALPTFIIGSIREFMDNEVLVPKYQQGVKRMKNGGATQDQIVESLYNKLTDDKLEQHVLLTDVMHLQNKTGDENAEVWFSAKTLKDALDKIQEIDENRIHDYFLDGGAQSEPAIQVQPITLAQVKDLVQKCLKRN